MLGFGHKPNAIQAAFTRSRLECLPGETKIRDEDVRYFLGRLSALPGLFTPDVPEGRTRARRFPRFRVDSASPPALAGRLCAALMRAGALRACPPGTAG
ncbi:hypothetical protein ACH427_26340 [Streptomyces sp. NPDC020379]|uniref:hypothetical protein n=1 Tax=Streptomyces sp. NPDC020379 TaxID=3365071 RepID=UPI0037881378